jgi:hypothetical protein
MILTLNTSNITSMTKRSERKGIPRYHFIYTRQLTIQVIVIVNKPRISPSTGASAG